MLIQQSLFDNYDDSLNENDSLKIVACGMVNTESYNLLFAIAECYGRMKAKEECKQICDMQKVILYGSSQHNYYSKANDLKAFKEVKELTYLNVMQLTKELQKLREKEISEYND